jgi:hypothetical protein|tara:strand:+ start:233 stop:346 length:114 start_codon:yes stop_codon:yes gene_type:complete
MAVLVLKTKIKNRKAGDIKSESDTIYPTKDVDIAVKG